MANILHNTPEDMQDENKHITEENAVSGRNNMSDIYVPVTIEEKEENASQTPYSFVGCDI